MRQNDKFDIRNPKPALAQLSDITEALALLTRLPVHPRETRGGAAAWAWPLAGVAVALLAGLVGYSALRLGVPPALAVGLILVAQIMLTGGLHEDGLADTVDGLWGGHDRARRLEIMKDSRIGSYGVLALGLSLLLRWGALSALMAQGWLFAPLLAVALVSRAPMAVLASALPNARGSGLSSQVGRPTQQTATLGVGLAILGALFLLGWGALAPVFWVALTSIALAALAKAKIGGQTGDILGATQQCAEIAAFVAPTAAL
ncbi:MAG TPA: adenosylcobinamide-GDP ribazoletransferase [Aliiroseovarius sp.]|nr:adenosylcobinamide-GDP ribazoletransferase [Aliiroseovarius sp.]